MRLARSWQHDAFSWTRGRDTIALFMDMRLGKSLVAVRWSVCRDVPGGKWLLVCPVSVIDGWVKELALEEEPEPVVLLGGTADKRIASVKASPQKWFITSYATLLNTPGLGACEFRGVVLDESDNIKNPTAKTTKRLRHDKLAKIPCRAILCGEPAMENLLDYYEQMAFVNGGDFCGCRNFWDFRSRYFVQTGFEWTPKADTRNTIARELACSAFSLRRSQTGETFGEPVRTVRKVQPPPELLRLQRSALKDWVLGGREAKYAVQLSGWLEQLACGVVDGETVFKHKLQELKTLLQGDLRHERVVVWCNWTAELHAARKLAASVGRRWFQISGETKPADRARSLAAFVKSETGVLVANQKCARYGLDMAACDTAIYLSRAWSGTVNAQSDARLCAAGKKAQNLYIDIITDHTLEQDKLDALRLKKADASAMRSAVSRLAKEAAR